MTQDIGQTIDQLLKGSERLIGFPRIRDDHSNLLTAQNVQLLMGDWRFNPDVPFVMSVCNLTEDTLELNIDHDYSEQGAVGLLQMLNKLSSNDQDRYEIAYKLGLLTLMSVRVKIISSKHFKDISYI